MCTQKMRALSHIGAEKITFSPKPDRQTDIHTYRRTDISVYRVASLLKRCYYIYIMTKECILCKDNLLCDVKKLDKCGDKIRY